ncbi:MAG: PD-(D/E)XK nuclease family protein [Candidatus Sericytochromatia bacterium]|nr:PD-(D/E)XK nuclease family protein [Candidatus Tanganyikabacteria bacterium]
MANTPLKLSASAVSAFAECPYRYARDYVDRLPDAERAPAPALGFGISVHRALAEFFRGGGHAVLTASDLIGLLRANWDRSQFTDTPEEQEYVRRGMDLMRRFWESRFPPREWVVTGIERWAEWPRPHRDIIARGRLDLVCRRPDGVVEVVDWKTGSRPATEEEMAADPQAAFYRSLAATAFGNPKPPDFRITFRYVGLGQSASIYFAEDDFREVWNWIAVAGEGIRKAAFVLNQGSALESAYLRKV